MRLRLSLTTRAHSIPWENLLRPGRGVIYHLLHSVSPTFTRALHDSGWGPHGMTPFAHNHPTFPQAPRTRGVFTVDGPGYLSIASPLPDLIDTLANALSPGQLLDWHGTALQVTDITRISPPEFADGRADFRTTTPVVVKATTDPDDLTAPRKGRDVLPHEQGFITALTHNLRRKATTLDLDPHVTINGPTWNGTKRGFATPTGRRTGAPIQINLHASPPLLQALWSWGLGQANSTGFGWITHPHDTPRPQKTSPTA